MEVKVLFPIFIMKTLLIKNRRVVRTKYIINY